MSMDLFEKVLARDRKPAPIEQRLPKVVSTITFASLLGWAGAGFTLMSGAFARQLGLAATRQEAFAALLQTLPLTVVFIGCALYVQTTMLTKFKRAQSLFPRMESQPMRMRWTPAKALVHKYVELLPPRSNDDSESAPAPVARALVEKNLRRFDTSSWEKPVTVHLSPEDPDRRVLIDDGRFLYAGRLLAKDETPPSIARRALVFMGFALVVGLLAAMERWLSPSL